MAFCPICNGNHDVGYSCYDRTSQALRDIGIDKKTSPEKIKKLSRETNKVILLIGIIAVIIIVILVFMTFLSER